MLQLALLAANRSCGGAIRAGSSGMSIKTFFCEDICRDISRGRMSAYSAQNRSASVTEIFSTKCGGKTKTLRGERKSGIKSLDDHMKRS
jgi:hypothetical protein